MARLNCTSLNPLSSVFLVRVSHRQMLARCGSRKEAAEISQPIDIVSDSPYGHEATAVSATTPPSPHKLSPCPTLPPPQSKGNLHIHPLRTSHHYAYFHPTYGQSIPYSLMCFLVDFPCSALCCECLSVCV